MYTASAALYYAASQIGTTESPRGSNRVPYWLVTKPEWNGSPWCAAFLQAGSLKFGVDQRDDFGWGAYYVPQIEAVGRKEKRWFSTPKVGDWVILGYTSSSHIGIVEKVISTGALGSTSLVIQTIEGNTSPTNVGSQNNGDGVYRKKRTGRYVRGFVRPPYVAAPAPSVPVVSKPKPKTSWTREDIKVMQRLLRAKVDGVWGANTQMRAQAFRAVAAASIPQDRGQIMVVQTIVGTTPDGLFGPATRTALPRKVIEFQRILGVAADGNWGPGTDRAYVAFHKAWRGR